MSTIILPTCPHCGCHDIRYEMWVGYKCFKCGLIIKEDSITPKAYFEYKVSEKTCG